MADTEEFLSSQEAAALLDSTEKAIQNWLEAGALPKACLLPDGSWSFSKDEVLALKRFLEDLEKFI